MAPIHFGPLELHEKLPASDMHTAIPGNRYASSRREGLRRRVVLPSRKELHRASKRAASAPALPALPSTVPKKTEARHLLSLPAGIEIDEIAVLALSRFATARWATVPQGISAEALAQGLAVSGPTDTTATSTAAMPRIAGGGEPGVMRLSRHSALTGPFTPAGSTLSAHLPANTEKVFDVICPRERWPQIQAFGFDRDGLTRTFPAGLPNREEERVVLWLLAVARRLGGAVLLNADEAAKSVGTLLIPDPAAAVDLTLYSDVWLDPAACQRVVLSVDPRAMLATKGVEYTGPADHDQSHQTGMAIDPEQARRLHEAADAFDRAALAEPHVLDGYGVNIDLGSGTAPDPAGGWIAVEVEGEENLPPLLRGQAWAAHGAVTYRVRWEPQDDHEANQERPNPSFCAARLRATTLVAKITHALWTATRGEIADDADFLLDPADLR